MNCEGACMDACLSTCEGCLACETVCEYGCESTCMKSCQDYCENICEYACENSCQSEQTPAERPDNWVWSTSTTSLGNTLFVMPYTKWNDFTQRINDFRVYKLGAGSEYNFTSVSSGTKLTPTILNQAVHAINEMLNVEIGRAHV